MTDNEITLKEFLEYRFNNLEELIKESKQDLKDHKDNHKWFVGLIITITGLMMGLIKKFI